jgi:4-hydroxymandelate oxidase
MSAAGPLPATIAELADRAAEVLGPDVLAYVEGGSADEITLRGNAAAWTHLALLPRLPADVSVRDLGISFLGRERPHPLIAAPMAYQRRIHAEGEAGAARGAAATGTVYCLSTLATSTAAEVAAGAGPGPRWFQLYVLRDRGRTRELVAGAVEAGFEALVITVDLPVLAARDRELRAGFALVTEDIPALRGASGETVTPRQTTDHIDASLTWDDIASIAADSGLPLVVKGLLTPDAARLAAEHGAAAIVVSNHGGRQLDTVPATAEALPAVVEAVGGRLDVLVDGGIRRGTDVLKALALGASGVMIGRPVLWGLAAGGAAGVQRVLELLLSELDIALALSGCPRAREANHGLVAAPQR